MSAQADIVSVVKMGVGVRPIAKKPHPSISPGINMPNPNNLSPAIYSTAVPNPFGVWKLL